MAYDWKRMPGYAEIDAGQTLADLAPESWAPAGPGGLVVPKTQRARDSLLATPGPYGPVSKPASLGAVPWAPTPPWMGGATAPTAPTPQEAAGMTRPAALPSEADYIRQKRMGRMQRAGDMATWRREYREMKSERDRQQRAAEKEMVAQAEHKRAMALQQAALTSRENVSGMRAKTTANIAAMETQARKHIAAMTDKRARDIATQTVAHQKDMLERRGKLDQAKQLLERGTMREQAGARVDLERLRQHSDLTATALKMSISSATRAVADQGKLLHQIAVDDPRYEAEEKKYNELTKALGNINAALKTQINEASEIKKTLVEDKEGKTEPPPEATGQALPPDIKDRLRMARQMGHTDAMIQEAFKLEGFSGVNLDDIFSE